MRQMVEEMQHSKTNSDGTGVYEEGEPSTLSISEEVDIMQKVLGRSRGTFVSGMGGALKKPTLKRGRPKGFDATSKLKEKLAAQEDILAQQAEELARLKAREEENAERLRALERRFMQCTARETEDTTASDIIAPQTEDPSMDITKDS